MNGEEHRPDRKYEDLTELRLYVPEHLYRAFQRCVWILINETGRDRRDIMREVVHDFLVKHGC
ncbi:MAG: hypothetical protein RBR09_13235 [Desulfobulbaceae bacterium]|jgi:hypothetical protein|nr:hypothetical protein [Desulfobulbaceae bacterium]MDY0352213.1 hypothetical protein [Desulfobulbaceae bacterium]